MCGDEHRREARRRRTVSSRPRSTAARSTSASPPSPPCSARRSSCDCSTRASRWSASTELGMPRRRYNTYSKLVHAPFGMVICAGPTGRRQDHHALRHAARDQLDGQERDDDRRPGRVRVPRHQPDPDQRRGRPHLRHRPQGHPAPGPRRDPRRRGPRRRHRPHRRAVGAHRSLRALLVARHRLASPPLHRLLDMGIEAFLVASAVVAVVGAAPPAADLRQLQRGVQPDRRRDRRVPAALAAAPTRRHFFHGVGCSYCASTGYRDRIGVYELLRITPELRRLIVGWATTEELRRLAVAQGMRTMLREAMAARRRRRHDHPRSRSDPVRELTAERRMMPKFAYSRSTPTGADGRGRHQGRHDRQRRARSWSSRTCSRSRSRKREGCSTSSSRKEKVKKKELMHFTRQLAVFVKAGIPITDALITIADEATDVALRRALTQHGRATCATAACSRMRRRTPRGVPELLHRHPRSRRSSPGASTSRSTTCPTTSNARSRRAPRWSAPSPIPGRHGDGVLHGPVLAGYVLPQFKPLFEELDAELPLPTRMMLFFARFFTDLWFITASSSSCSSPDVVLVR